MNQDSLMDFVFCRDRFWFLDPNRDDESFRPPVHSMLPALTVAFNNASSSFLGYSDQKLQSGLMFLASIDGVGKSLIDEKIELTLRSNFLLSHLVMFQDVVVPRAKNPDSELNEVCFFYWDSLIEYSCLEPSRIETTEIFWSLHHTMHSLFGLLPALDSGINRAFARWFPHLLTD